MRIIDAHIHLDLYEPALEKEWIAGLPAHGVEGVVAVSVHMDSCLQVQKWHRQFPDLVHPAYGFHPERPLVSEEQFAELFSWMETHRPEMKAIGEVGLPYYTRTEKERKGESFPLDPYVEVLERFVRLAAQWELPVVLHAVYEDAGTACDLLEKHSVRKAHFHWFKGDDKTVARMIANGYYVSFTPDIVYEREIQQLAARYPLEQTMVETDGPWPFEGPFAGRQTHPRMIAASIGKLAEIKRMAKEEVAQMLYQNTKRFYGISC